MKNANARVAHAGAIVLGVAVFVFCSIFPAVNLAHAEPRFQDYSARAYSGRVQSPDLSSHPDAGTYRTRLRNAANGGINFAGDHVLATWGCGGQCLMGAVINARSGHVQFLPGTICCWLEAGEDINPVDFERGSNLLILTGLLNEEEPMTRYYYDFSGREFQMIEKQVLAANTAGTGSGGGGPQSAELDICYYDSNGAQHDADWCKTGSDISIAGNVNLDPHCFSNAGAVCQLGNSGGCRPGSLKYNRYVIFPHRSGRCPTTFNAAVGSSGGGGPQTVAPSCPAGFVLSGSQCVKAAAPVPICPSGFVLSGTQCVRTAVPTPNCPPGFNFSQGQCVRSAAAPPPPVNTPAPPVVRKVMRCSQVKFGFTQGNTCACSDNRIFNGTACVRPQQTGGGPQLPICPNAVNGICERQAFNECDGVQPQVKFNQCIDHATTVCERQNGCRN